MLRSMGALRFPRWCALLVAAVLAAALTGTSVSAAQAAGLPLALTCTGSWTTGFAPGVLLTTSQNGTITISGGALATCVDTSGQGPSAITSGTFSGSGSYSGTCLTGTSAITLALTWQLADGGTDHSVASVSGNEATLAALSQLTITSGRLAGDAMTVANVRTQENVGDCLTTGLTQVTATGVVLVTAPL